MNHFRVEMGDVHENGLSVEFFIINDHCGPGEVVEVEGSLKWDGCMNWMTEEGCMGHLCSPADLDLLADAFREVWRQGAVLLGDKWIGGDKLEPAA